MTTEREMTIRLLETAKDLEARIEEQARNSQALREQVRAQEQHLRRAHQATEPRSDNESVADTCNTASLRSDKAYQDSGPVPPTEILWCPHCRHRWER